MACLPPAGSLSLLNFRRCLCLGTDVFGFSFLAFFGGFFFGGGGGAFFGRGGGVPGARPNHY